MNHLIIHILLCGLRGALGNIVLADCQIITSTFNWTVSGSCRVQRNASEYNHNCTWKLNTVWRSFGQFDSGGEICSFTQPLEINEGTYTYSIHFTPPSAATYSGEVKIVQPGTVMTSCAQVVDGGADLNCSCLTSKPSSPPAIVKWEGRDSEKLMKTNVQREDNGTQFTCHVTWAGRVYKSLIYTLIVNYTKGPDGVIIIGPRDLTNNASHIIELVCSTTAPVYPGVMFTWTGGVCQNETHTANSSRCYFPSDVNLDKKLITCTAINSNDNISFSTSVILKINGSGRDLDEEDSHTPVMSSNDSIIAAVVTVVAAVFITLVLITIVVQRKANSKKQTDRGRTLPRPDDDFEEHINVVYQSSDDVIPISNTRYVIEISNKTDFGDNHLSSAGPLRDVEAPSVSSESSPRFSVQPVGPAISEEHLYAEVKDVNL